MANGISADGDTALANVIGYYNDVTLNSNLSINIAGDLSDGLDDVNSSNYDEFLNTGVMAEQTSASDCLVSGHVATANLAVFFDDDGSFFLLLD
ncbi:MAG: hypothetical protein R3A45_03965 [Bdellovibrionota bacterium]